MFGKMHVLPNYWRIKYEKRCVESGAEIVQGQKRFHSKGESRRRADSVRTCVIK